MDKRLLSRAESLLQRFLSDGSDDDAIVSLRLLISELRRERIEAIEKRLADIELTVRYSKPTN